MSFTEPSSAATAAQEFVVPRSMPMIGSFFIGIRGFSVGGQSRPGRLTRKRLAEIPGSARFAPSPSREAGPGAFGQGSRQARLSVAVGQGTRVNAKECLETVGTEVGRDFVEN